MEYLDLIYDNLGNKLDMYLPNCKNYDTIVYFHGGGIESGSKSQKEFVEMARDFVKAGYGFVSVDYRMYQTAKYPEYLIDSANSVKFVLDNIKNYGGSGKVFVSGQSAGAYMSLMLLTDNEFFDNAKVDRSLIKGYLIDSAQTTTHFNILKYEYKINSLYQRIDERSPIYHLKENGNYPPILIIYYEKDMANRREQNELFISALKNLNYDAIVDKKILSGTHCTGSTYKNANGKYDFVETALEFLKNRF